MVFPPYEDVLWFFNKIKICHSKHVMWEEYADACEEGFGCLRGSKLCGEFEYSFVIHVFD
uniref:Uncharacterized protein n=1 Tax=Rhizophora mucronata TaxID=61149 RepID=A0A2P2NR36_RHIMU